MLRPGIPLSPFLVTHTKPYLFYACGNVIFKFSVDVAGSAEFCGKNDTCHSGTVRSISHSGDELLTCGDDKILAILDHGLSCLRRRVMGKKLSSAYVVGSHILVADRFGDIYRIKSDLSGEAEFFFSHYTTITASTLMANLSLTGNKDGKIVVLDAHNPFLVLAICQGHSEFITCLKPYGDDKFISCSADGKLRAWDLDQFTELQTVDLHELACDEFGPGMYVPFYILTESGDSFIAVLFAHPSMMMVFDVWAYKYRWIQLPFEVQSAAKLPNHKISEILEDSDGVDALSGYFFLDMCGDLWNNVGNAWHKIEVQAGCSGELVDFWKQNEGLKGGRGEGGAHNC